jgi:PAS domain S-box-containing protein
LRIGFEVNPPLQTRTANGYSGLGVDVVREAAKRAGIQLNWIETGTSSEEAFRKGLVDMWPLMVDLPARRRYVHFARPWMSTSHVLVMREGTPVPDHDFAGRIAVFKLPLHLTLLKQAFPRAQTLVNQQFRDVLKQVCLGEVAAGFVEGRMVLTELRQRPPECESTALRVVNIPGARFQAGMASTFEAAGAADQIQAQIEKMFHDGSMAVLIGEYSYFGLDDTWASYQQIAETERWRLLTWVGAGLVVVIVLTVWMATSLRQRKRAEAALRESEGRFRSLANGAPVMIVASGPDGRATFFNKTWLDFTGRTVEEAVDYGWLEIVHPDDRERTRTEFLKCIGARKDCRLEYRLRRADEEFRHVVCSGVPRLDLEGRFAGYVASCLDLTDIKRAQEEALSRQNLESLGVLAGGIAHDFNNLLGGVIAYCELAEERIAEGSPVGDELRQINAAAVRGSEIVRQLMIYAGHEQPVRELVDVSLLIGEMLELLKVSISKHAVLRPSLGKDLPRVRGNPAQIRQVVMNLVTNASEALAEKDGVIRIVTEHIHVDRVTGSSQPGSLPEGDYLRLEVSDTGCGMTPQTQSKVFDPFFTTKFAGRGMGLAVVQRIVRQLGGAINVVSAVGQGTSVHIALPCAATTAGMSTVAKQLTMPSRESRPAGGSSILVVEDEPMLLAAVAKMLRQNGFAVMEAQDGSAALERIRTADRIDAMLLDVTLPGVSSREVFEEAGRRRRDLVTILTSAYAEQVVKDSFAGLAVDHFLRKPFQIEELLCLLADLLAARERMARLAPPRATDSTAL